MVIRPPSNTRLQSDRLGCWRSRLSCSIRASRRFGAGCETPPAAEPPIRWAARAVLPLDTLHTIAEVGIAITGFAGIVAAIRGGGDSAAQPSIADPLGVLLTASIGTVFFCFVPEWLDSAIAEPDLVWRVSLAAYGTYRLAYITLILNARRRGLGANLGAWRFSVGVSLGVLQLVGAAGFLTEFQYFLYLSGLLWGLMVALLSFYTLLRDRTPE